MVMSGIAMILLFAYFVPIAPVARAATGFAHTILITGSNRGIGFEFARQYAADGWNVIATARRPEGADALQALAAEYPNVQIERLDVTDFAMIDALAEKLKDRPIDVVLNNAGISGDPNPEQVFRKLNYDLFDPYMHTNALGPLKISEAFLPNVEASEKKLIAVVSSRAGSFSELPPGSNPGTIFYRASKAALNMLMAEVAATVKRRGVTVVIMNPGMVDTRDGLLTEMNEKMNLGLLITPIEDSVGGMRSVIEDTSLEDSGNLYQYTGQQMGF